MKKRRHKSKDRRTVFLIFAILLIIGGAFLFGFPFLPKLTLIYKKSVDPTDGFKYKSNLALSEGGNVNAEELKPIPKDNRLVIPKIQVDAPIKEGNSMNVLKEGLWHRPNTPSPVDQGNSVIVGHRNIRGLATPITLYHLDKIKVGDRFAIFWEGEEIDYEVFDTKIVKANDQHVEAQTHDTRLTIYTCTWNSKKRRVVVASPINILGHL